MIVVSKPLGGLFSVPDFGLSEVLSIQREKRAKTIQRLAGQLHQVTLKSDEKGHV